MTQKPEWFEIADNDEQTADFIEPVKAKNKSLPITAAIASAAIIIGGAFFANANNEQSASADDQSPAVVAQAGTPAASASSSATPTAPGVQNPTTTNGATPSIGQLPQGRGDHEGGDDRAFGDGDGDHQFPADGQRPPHREGGEHHGPRPGTDLNNAPTSSDED